MDNNKIYEIIDYYKNHSDNWIKELWMLTEEYFNKRVLPLLVFHPLTDYDKTYILFHGFRNILNLNKSKRFTYYPKGNSLMETYMFSNQVKNSEEIPLDKSNINMELFETFIGFTFIASKDEYFLSKLYIKNKESSELNEKVRNFKSASEEQEIDIRNLNNELGIAYKKIKSRAKKGIKEKNSSIRYTDLLREKTFESELKKIADATRKKNGKLNYSKIASLIDSNISNHTIKKWCNKYKIPPEVPYLSR